MTVKHVDTASTSISNNDPSVERPMEGRQEGAATSAEEGDEEYVEAAAEQAVDVAENNNNNNNNNDSDDDDDDNSWRAKKIRHWKNNPFAVGIVNPTWKDDRTCCGTGLRKSDINHNVWSSAYFCGCAGRVGNLVVLAQTTEEINDDDNDDGDGGDGNNNNNNNRRKKQRPKLLWVVGPYWPVNLCLTFPLILGISFWTCYTRVVGNHIAVIITWSICTAFLVFALLMVACKDPGVLYRQKQLPVGAEDWRWNDQARTFRPPRARFDPECQVVVEGFDHVCPWTGTAIGSRNMYWFKIFVCMVPVCIVYTVILHIMNF